MMKNYSALKLALIISSVGAVLAAGAMVVAVLASEGDKDWGTVITIGVLMVALFLIGTFALRRVLKKFAESQKLVPIPHIEEPAMIDDSANEGLSQIISQVNDDVAQWAKDKVNEITVLRNNEQFRREYLGNVAHELKTPLNNIQGYIETLLDGGLQDDEINTKYLTRADRNISRLISIVEDLDTISKFESGMLKLKLEDFDIVDVIDEVLEFNEKKASEKHIALKLIDRPQNPVMVRADKGRIYEVLNNLVVNSINYGNENGTTKVLISDIENKYLVDVKDDGIGISADNIGRVFERFFRVDKSRSRESGGTGLGLAIVKHIMEAHNELVTVKSKIGEGTTFSFTLKKA